MKYVILEVTDPRKERPTFMPIVFPNAMIHREVAVNAKRIIWDSVDNGRNVAVKPIAAGFVTMNFDGNPICTGESESLSLKSRGEIDADLIALYFMEPTRNG